MRNCLRAAACAVMAAALVSPAAAAAAAPAAAPAARSRPPAVHAVAAALYDPAAGSFLWSDHPDRELPVGSLTKLMTAWLALRQPTSTPVKVGRDVAGIPQTIAGLVPGRTYTLGSLLPVLIVRSANDAAVAIADALGGNVPDFVARMNAEAAAMGLKDTHYANPNGLDADGQHSSARDVAELAATDMGIAAFRQLAELRAATLPGGATFTDENPFLGAYPGADGVKTGFTSTAGFCMAASATRGGRMLIAVVLDESSWTQAVADASALLTWGFANAPATASAETTGSASGTAAGVAGAGEPGLTPEPGPAVANPAAAGQAAGAPASQPAAASTATAVAASAATAAAAPPATAAAGVVPPPASGQTGAATSPAAAPATSPAASPVTAATASPATAGATSPATAAAASPATAGATSPVTAAAASPTTAGATSPATAAAASAATATAGAAPPAASVRASATTPGPKPAPSAGSQAASPRTTASPPRHIARAASPSAVAAPEPAGGPTTGGRLAWLALAAAALLAIAGSVIRRRGARRDG